MSRTSSAVKPARRVSATLAMALSTAWMMRVAVAFCGFDAEVAKVVADWR
jgi:hypothetical protein